MDKKTARQLVKLIEERSPLWDCSHPQSRREMKSEELWAEISAILKFPIIKCKHKYSNLLTTYRLQKMKEKLAYEKGETYKCSWFGYDWFSFLERNDSSDSGENKTHKMNGPANSDVDSGYRNFLHMDSDVDDDQIIEPKDLEEKAFSDNETCTKDDFIELKVVPINTDNQLQGPRNDSDSQKEVKEKMDEDPLSDSPTTLKITSIELLDEETRFEFKIKPPFTQWSHSENLKFIELYKSCPMLWDGNSEYFKNTIVRRRAYDYIQEKFKDVRPLSIDGVKNKINSLRSSYKLAAGRRAQQFMKTGVCSDPTIPWFHYFKGVMVNYHNENAEQFQNQSESTKCDKNQSSKYSQELNLVAIIKETAPDSDNFLEIIRTSKINAQVDIKQEHSDEEMQLLSTCAPEEDIYEIEVDIGMETIKSETYEDDRDESANETKETGIKLEFAENKFQTFADNLVAELNQMPLDKALELQMEIQQLVEKQRSN